VLDEKISREYEGGKNGSEAVPCLKWPRRAFPALASATVDSLPSANDVTLEPNRASLHDAIKVKILITRTIPNDQAMSFLYLLYCQTATSIIDSKYVTRTVSMSTIRFFISFPLEYTRSGYQ